MPDSIDLLFLRSSCAFMKWETENNFKKIESFSHIIVFSCKLLPLFRFFFFIPLNPFKWVQEGSEKQQINRVWPHQLSQVVHLYHILYSYTNEFYSCITSFNFTAASLVLFYSSLYTCIKFYSCNNSFTAALLVL